MERPVFRGYVKWYGETDSSKNHEHGIRVWMLERFDYEVVVPDSTFLDLRDVGGSVVGDWSAYSSRVCDGQGHYFFDLGSDAMAFKLRWL